MVKYIIAVIIKVWLFFIIICRWSFPIGDIENNKIFSLLKKIIKIFDIIFNFLNKNKRHLSTILSTTGNRGILLKYIDNVYFFPFISRYSLNDSIIIFLIIIKWNFFIFPMTISYILLKWICFNFYYNNVFTIFNNIWRITFCISKNKANYIYINFIN